MLFLGFLIVLREALDDFLKWIDPFSLLCASTVGPCFSPWPLASLYLITENKRGGASSLPESMILDLT